MSKELLVFEKGELHPEGDLRDKAHAALDQIINRWCDEESNTGGGAIIEGHCPDNHKHTYRVSFIDFTNGEECPFCDGSGLHGQ